MSVEVLDSVDVPVDPDAADRAVVEARDVQIGELEERARGLRADAELARLAQLEDIAAGGDGGAAAEVARALEVKVGDAAEALAEAQRRRAAAASAIAQREWTTAKLARDAEVAHARKRFRHAPDAVLRMLRDVVDEFARTGRPDVLRVWSAREEVERMAAAAEQDVAVVAESLRQESYQLLAVWDASAVSWYAVARALADAADPLVEDGLPPEVERHRAQDRITRDARERLVAAMTPEAVARAQADRMNIVIRPPGLAREFAPSGAAVDQ